MELGFLTEVTDGSGNVTGSLERLAGSDPSQYADCASIEALHRALASLEAFVTAATACFDASGAWEPDGARNAAAWIATRCSMSAGSARREVRRGRALRHLPGCARAWADGDITAAHVDAFAGLRRDATEEALRRDEELLLDDAKRLRFEHFIRAITYWEQCADPDGTEAAAELRRSRRDVYLAPGLDGTFYGRITLDPVSGEIVTDELGRLEAELFDADRNEARERLGRDPVAGDLVRTAAQRRADALVEMAARSRSAAPDGRRPAPLFSVYVGYETLYGRICELASGTVVSPGSLLTFLDQSYIERAVFGPGTRVEVSESARFFTGATRRAIVLRDRRCTHPYCDAPAKACQGDHIVPFAEDGPTTQENGQLRCPFHNRLRSKRPPPGDAA
jgi:hypothetical protein